MSHTLEQREQIFASIMAGEHYYAEAYDFEKRRWTDAVLRRVRSSAGEVVEAIDADSYAWTVPLGDLLDPKQFRSFMIKLRR